MKTFDLIVSSPDGDLFRGEVQALVVRGTEGELAILADHIPFITAVVACDAKIVLPDDSDRIAELDGGLLTVSQNNVTLLSSGVKWKE
ncbi:MAG: F0F1 ATP synthase subunit epsilon [Ruminococcaceae bacterium]|nr:F0F1 ATP synthase subunit epsilon [Oscillospiraceae bacterium]